MVRPLWKSETIQAWHEGSGSEQRTCRYAFAARLEQVALLMAQIARVTSAGDDACPGKTRGSFMELVLDGIG